MLDFDLLASPLREHPHHPATAGGGARARPRLDEAFEAAAEAIPALPLSAEAHGHRIDHGDDLPH